jgi:sodium-dependent dicarboxylate transporter 2/3/5
MSIAFFVMMMTNFIMNVAAIAISLPVALVIAPYLGVAGEVILFASLVVAGMPFLLLVGAAPNAIAYDSKQFTTGEFFCGESRPALMLMIVTGFAVNGAVAHHGHAHTKRCRPLKKHKKNSTIPSTNTGPC